MRDIKVSSFHNNNVLYLFLRNLTMVHYGIKVLIFSSINKRLSINNGRKKSLGKPSEGLAIFTQDWCRPGRTAANTASFKAVTINRHIH